MCSKLNYSHLPLSFPFCLPLLLPLPLDCRIWDKSNITYYKTITSKTFSPASRNIYKLACRVHTIEIKTFVTLCTLLEEIPVQVDEDWRMPAVTLRINDMGKCFAGQSSHNLALGSTKSLIQFTVWWFHNLG